ncbi:MAG: hypothetical protein K2N73_09680 [Lachnospiraceae bacterium]|nr:hypothetical protein [Lachnospiraceae bacterium]
MKSSILKKAVGILTHNIGLKLLAVVVSCGLWFVVNSITDPVEKKVFNNVSVDIVNEDMITSEGKVYEILDGTNYVNVTVMGKRSVLDYITKDDLKAVADMSKLTFMNTVGIEVSSTRNNSDLDFKTNIDNVKLLIENRKSIQKSIIASASGDPAEGYVVDRALASPNVVRFSGPESLIMQIDHVEAVANIEGASSDITTSVDLKIYDAANNEIKGNSIKMNISTVNVSVSILATKEVPLEFTIQGEPEEGYIVSKDVVSVPEMILIAGRSSVLDGVSRITVADPSLNAENLTESTTSIVNINKYLPSGVQFADGSFSGNVSVTIEIEKLVTKELEIPARNFAAGYKPEGFQLTLKELEDEDSYVIRISGTQAAVDVINAEEIIGVVDMNQIRDNLGLQEWAVGSYEGDITFNIPDNVTLVETYKMTVELGEIEEDAE